MNKDNKLNKPIGVFDSGIGGLNVLRELQNILPNENYIYIADQLYCPYGLKSNQVIKTRVIKICQYFRQVGAKMIVIACNTASLFLAEVSKIIDLPILGVIEPTAHQALKKINNKTPLVLATSATIQNGAYQKIFDKFHIVSINIPCSEFVDLVESDFTVEEKLEVIQNKLANYRNQKDLIVIYGCTHFDLIDKDIKAVLGDQIYISGAKSTALLVKETLTLSKICRNSNAGVTKIYTTKSRSSLEKGLRWLVKKPIEIKEIEVE